MDLTERPDFAGEAGDAGPPVSTTRNPAVRGTPLIDAAREVVRFYGTDRTWSLTYRTLLGSRIDDLDTALVAIAPPGERLAPAKIDGPAANAIAGPDPDPRTPTGWLEDDVAAAGWPADLWMGCGFLIAVFAAGVVVGWWLG